MGSGNWECRAQLGFGMAGDQRRCWRGASGGWPRMAAGMNTDGEAGCWPVIHGDADRCFCRRAAEARRYTCGRMAAAPVAAANAWMDSRIGVCELSTRRWKRQSTHWGRICRSGCRGRRTSRPQTGGCWPGWRLKSRRRRKRGDRNGDSKEEGGGRSPHAAGLGSRSGSARNTGSSQRRS